MTLSPDPVTVLQVQSRETGRRVGCHAISRLQSAGSSYRDLNYSTISS